MGTRREEKSIGRLFGTGSEKTEHAADDGTGLLRRRGEQFRGIDPCLDGGVPDILLLFLNLIGNTGRQRNGGFGSEEALHRAGGGFAQGDVCEGVAMLPGDTDALALQSEDTADEGHPEKSVESGNGHALPHAGATAASTLR